MWVHFMGVEIGMKPGTMICICYDNIQVIYQVA